MPYNDEKHGHQQLPGSMLDCMEKEGFFHCLSVIDESVLRRMCAGGIVRSQMLTYSALTGKKRQYKQATVKNLL